MKKSLTSLEYDALCLCVRDVELSRDKLSESEKKLHNRMIELGLDPNKMYTIGIEKDMPPNAVVVVYEAKKEE